MATATTTAKQRVTAQIAVHAANYESIRRSIVRSSGLDIAVVDENNVPQPYIREADKSDSLVETANHVYVSGANAADFEAPAESVELRPEDVLPPSQSNNVKLNTNETIRPEVRVTERGSLKDIFVEEFEKVQQLGYNLDFDPNWGNPRKGYRGLTRRAKQGDVSIHISTNLAGQRLAIRVEHDENGSPFTTVMYERETGLEIATSLNVSAVSSPIEIIEFFQKPLRHKH